MRDSAQHRVSACGTARHRAEQHGISTVEQRASPCRAGAWQQPRVQQRAALTAYHFAKASWPPFAKAPWPCFAKAPWPGALGQEQSCRLLRAHLGVEALFLYLAPTRVAMQHLSMPRGLASELPGRATANASKPAAATLKKCGQFCRFACPLSVISAVSVGDGGVYTPCQGQCRRVMQPDVHCQ